MLNSSVNEFCRKLDVLNENIEMQKDMKDFLYEMKSTCAKNNPDLEKIVSSYTNVRVFNYCSNIISLYGILEHFVENLCKEYLEKLSESGDDNRMPLDDYFNRITRLSEKLTYPKYKNIQLSDLVENLYCVVVKGKNTYLSECYIQNGGNYRHKVIGEIFKALGRTDIDSKLCKYEPLNSHIENKYERNDNKILSEKLDELVDRRNILAHGIETDDILFIDDIQSLLEFIRCYGLSLNKYLNDYLFSIKWKQISKDTIKITHTYKAGRVAEFKLKDKQITSTPVVLLKKTNNMYPMYEKINIKEVRVEESSGITKTISEPFTSNTFLTYTMSCSTIHQFSEGMQFCILD